MRTISAELLEAARSWRGEVAAQARVRNRRWRWQALASGAGAECPSAMVAVGAVVHRVRVNGTALEYAQVTEVADPAQWTAWQTLNQEARAGSDVALAAGPNGELRAVYRVEVGGTPRLRVLASGDGGASWAALPDPVAAPEGDLAAADQRVFYVENGQVQSQGRAYGGGTWNAGAPWAALSLSVWRGLGASYDAEAGLYRVIAAGDGATPGAQVWLGSYDPLADTWSAPLALAPWGDGPASGETVLGWPAILCLGAEDGWLATWHDQFQGTPAWSQPVVLRSADGEHWGDEVALDVGSATPRRIALAYSAARGQVFAGHAGEVVATTLYRADHAGQNVNALPLRAYTRRTDADGSRLQVEGWDPAGTWQSAGQVGTPGEALQPLAELFLERGYRLADGAFEWVALDPHYLIAVGLGAGREAGRLFLEAVDGWGLLARWSPAEPITWVNRTLGWLLAELCAKVGLAAAPSGDPLWQETLPRLSLWPTTHGAAAVRALLALVGAVGWFDSAGALCAAPLASYQPLVPLEVGERGEILAARYAACLPSGTAWRVYGEGAAAAGERAGTAMRLGLRRVRTREDHRLASEALALSAVAGEQARAGVEARRDAVLVPLRPEVELWDLARLWADPALIPPEDCLRRVLEIHERYDPARGVAVTRLELG